MRESPCPKLVQFKDLLRIIQLVMHTRTFSQSAAYGTVQHSRKHDLTAAASSRSASVGVVSSLTYCTCIKLVSCAVTHVRVQCVERNQSLPAYFSLPVLDEGSSPIGWRMLFGRDRGHARDQLAVASYEYSVGRRLNSG